MYNRWRMNYSTLISHIATTIRDVLGSEHASLPVAVGFTADPGHGDLVTNAAMVGAKPLGLPPRELATRIVDALQALPEIERVDVAGPGFINMWLQPEVLGELVRGAAGTRPGLYAGKRVLVEYSDPNPFKPLHAGHLYTTLVGDMIARLYVRGGADVTRLNYGGDVGLHVAKSMWAIVRHFGGELPEKLDEISPYHRPIWLGERYVEGNNAYEDSDELREEIVSMNRRVYALHTEQDHDSPLAQIYWTCRTWSYEYFQKLYEELDVVAFDRYIPESEVTPLGTETVMRELERGVYTRSDGAIVYAGERAGLHTRVFINSVGLPTYEAKDVGLLLTKWRDYAFDTSVVITAREQEEYMRVMLASVREFDPEPANRSVHMVHGAVKLAGGVKMSSRRGNVVMALDILEAARKASELVSRDVQPGSVLAAVKYAFAKTKVGNDIIYDPVESVALEGNSGPYLQYAHARACSILAKSVQHPSGSENDKESSVPHGYTADERVLALKISAYADVLEEAVAERMPHDICTYLYELSQTFNRFYEHNRVVGDEREAVRLQLVTAYRRVLADGLELLGIEAPERL